MTFVLSFVPEIDATPSPVVTPCSEMGRVTRCYVSAYQRNREHCSNVGSREKRCLIADFNGAIPSGRTITSVTWSCLNPYIVNMLQADVTDRETACLIQCQYGGVSLIRCDATFDNGEIYVQMFRLNISQVAWFQGDTPFSQGPYTLTAVQA
jgi:hypothetical protein